VGPDPARKLLLGPQSADVRFIGIQRSDEYIEDTEPPQHLQHVLDADAAVAPL
jgi:hypothetical protein